MPIITPPISDNMQEDSWKQSATETIRFLEVYIKDLNNQIEKLTKRVEELEAHHQSEDI